MAKVQNFSEISPDLPFTEFDFYELYRRTFETSELGKIRKRLPLGEMAENFGLISKSMRAKKGRKTYFTPEGKVALMFLKMYTGLSSPKLMEHLNGNVHYQLFCDVRIDPMHPLTNYKLLDDVFSEVKIFQFVFCPQLSVTQNCYGVEHVSFCWGQLPTEEAHGEICRL